MDINEDARKARREYYREWRRKNPERAAKIQVRYWLKKAEEMRSQEAAAGDPAQKNQD